MPDKCILASFAEARQAFCLKLDLHHKSGMIFALSYELLRATRMLSAKKKKAYSSAQRFPSLLCSYFLIS